MFNYISIIQKVFLGEVRVEGHRRFERVGGGVEGKKEGSAKGYIDECLA